MWNTISIPARVVCDFLSEMAANHGDVEVDIEIIETLVKGWSDGGHAPLLATLATKLSEMAAKLDHDHDLGLGFDPPDEPEQ